MQSRCRRSLTLRSSPPSLSLLIPFRTTSVSAVGRRRRPGLACLHALSCQPCSLAMKTALVSLPHPLSIYSTLLSESWPKFSSCTHNLRARLPARPSMLYVPPPRMTVDNQFHLSLYASCHCQGRSCRSIALLPDACAHGPTFSRDRTRLSQCGVHFECLYMIDVAYEL